MNIEIDLGESVAELEADLALSISQLQKAVSRALKKVARWLETHSKRELGVALGVPQRVLEARYYKTFYMKNDQRSVSLWFGLEPISAQAFGKPVQTDVGVKVGKHHFIGAFMATMKNGHAGIFKRKYEYGSKRTKRIKRPDGQWTELPIEEVRFPINEIARPIIERYYVRAEARFKQLLKQEINFVMNVEGA
ncbi:hypothetical protein [Marinomonas transparens]|uniref:Prophage minor tail protein Z (GPZ) n=1 Tax=Marinomonas transparens TaxID=2795388 RepID=A0A934JZS7_9GAMM|nr:hypothetical protein [Marinomonas transparens]MBJ7539892.1 hypothetical protein [Marinomonas transparens]